MCTAQIFPAWVKYVWKYLLVGVIFWWAKREDLLSVLHVYGSILRNLRGLFFSSFPLKSTNCSSWESLAGVNPQLFSRWRTFFQKVLCIFWRDSWETAGGLWVLSTMNEEKKYRVWWECGILLLWSLDVPFLKQKVGEVLQMLVFVHVWGNYWVFWGTKKKKKLNFVISFFCQCSVYTGWDRQQIVLWNMKRWKSESAYIAMWEYPPTNTARIQIAISHQCFRMYLELGFKMFPIACNPFNRKGLFAFLYSLAITAFVWKQSRFFAR